jgi:hypothetical protein
MLFDNNNGNQNQTIETSTNTSRSDKLLLVDMDVTGSTGSRRFNSILGRAKLIGDIRSINQNSFTVQAGDTISAISPLASGSRVGSRVDTGDNAAFAPFRNQLRTELINHPLLFFCVDSMNDTTNSSH